MATTIKKSRTEGLLTTFV